MQPLLKVDSLQKHFASKNNALFGGNKSKVKAVDGISFEIAEGETLGLVESQVAEKPLPDEPY